MKKLLLSLLIAPLAALNAQGWMEQNTGFTALSRGINHISIADANTVWAQAYDGSGAGEEIREFTRTTDGGNTWMPGVITIANTDYQLTNLQAINGTTAWVGAFDPDFGMGGAYKTTDGGATWTLMTPGKFNTTTTGENASFSWFNAVHFFDEQNGIVMGDPFSSAPSAKFEIYYTSNGGTTWTGASGVGTGSSPGSLGEYSYTDMTAAAGSSFWFGTSGGRLVRTTNKGVGNSWSVFTTPIDDFNGSQIIFNDPNNGVIIKAGMIYKSTDGGATWSAGATYAGFPNVTGIPGTMTLVSTGAAAGNSGSAYSPDMGTTWIPIDDGVQHTAVAFLNGTTGWTGGFSGPGGVGGIFKFDGNLRASNPDAVQVSVSPNPTNGAITITGAAVSSVSVFDLTGKKVYANEFANVENAVVDLSALQTGAYMLQAKAENGAVKTVKVLKQ